MNRLRREKMKDLKINISKKFNKIQDLWKPRVIAEMNNYQFKLAKVKDEFIWHSHDDTDEVFLVIEGLLVIYFRTHEVELRKGEMYVVPKGVEHKPYAKEECQIMLIEPKGVVNTGSKRNQFTAENDVWI